MTLTPAQKEPVPIKVVFQGGGAKLVTLMAAASVVQDLENHGDVKIQRVVGVSAGAIAACMLASHESLDTYRERAINAGSDVIAMVEQLPNKWRMLFRAWRGKSVFPDNAIRKFCNNVFGAVHIRVDADEKLKPLTCLGQLPIATTIIASNARHCEKTIYDSKKQPEKRLEDALTDSCAIPFVFRGYKDNAFIVDGGVCGNLPDLEVSRSGEDGAFVLGFGFDSETAVEPFDLLTYASALISTSMDSAVRDSMARIKSSHGVVCELPHEFGTFGFKEALETGLSAEHFHETRDRIRPDIDRAIRRFRERMGSGDDENALRTKFMRVFKHQVSRFPYSVERVAIVIKADSLMARSHAGFIDYDEVTHMVSFRPKKESLSCVRISLSVDSSAPLAEESDFRLTTAGDTTVNAVQVVVHEQHDVIPNLNSYDNLLFFQEPVPGTVDAVRRVLQRNSMSGLVAQEGVDWLSHQNRSTQDSMSHDCVLLYPNDLGEVTVVDLVEHVQLLPEVKRPKDFATMKSCWTVGRPMTAAELSSYTSGLPPRGYKLVGWRAESVTPKHFCGTIFRRQK